MHTNLDEGFSELNDSHNAMSMSIDSDSSFETRTVDETVDETVEKPSIQSLKRKADDVLHSLQDELATPQSKKRCSETLQGTSWDPTSRQAVRDRLLSFTPLVWKTKPETVSAYLFAFRGWKCVEEDILMCVCCGKLIDSSLPSLIAFDSSTFLAAVKRLRVGSLNAHETTCPLRFARIRRSFEIESPLSVYEEGYRSRCKSLENLALSDVNMDEPDLLSDNLVNIVEAPNRKVAILVLCGWSKSESMSDAISCEYCGRTIGLWMFRSEESLNPSHEHYTWCSALHRDRHGTPGWVCIANELYRISMQNDFSMKAELKKKRKIMDEATMFI